MFLLFFACSTADPEIMQVDLRIHATLAEAGTEIREELVIYLDIHDPDGIEDVAWVVVELPEYGIGWELEDEDLHYVQRGEEHWFGSALIVPGRHRIPRGIVRVIVGDLSGRTAERRIRIPGSTIVPNEADFPVPDGEGRIALSPGATRHFLYREGYYRELYRSEPRENDDGGRYHLNPEVLDELGDEPFQLVAEWSPFLWMESGPWDYSDFSRPR